MPHKEYEVGYKKPPQKTRFRKGYSGNPAGRPKGSKNTYKLLEELLDQKVLISQEGKLIKLSKKVVILQQMVNRAVKGELKAAQFLLPHMAIIDSKNEEKENSADNLSPNDQEIIANFLKAHSDDL